MLGNAVHHALERAFGLPIEDRSVKTLHRALRAVWSQHRKPDTFASREEEAEYGRAGLEMLTMLAENFSVDATPLAREQWLSARLENGVEIFGKADRIDRTRDGGELEIVDWKTSRHPMDADDVGDQSAAQVYAIAAEATYGRPVSKVRFIYLPVGIEVAWSPEREEIEAARERLVTLTNTIRSDGEFVADPGLHCRWCRAALICTDRQRVELDQLTVPEDSPF